jgi:glycogen phosphorylase
MRTSLKSRRLSTWSSLTFSAPDERGVFAPLRDVLLTHGDYYMHLADLTSYCQAQEGVGSLYTEPQAWALRAILNIASSGKFSSDRTIGEYASEIWKVEPCPVA